MTSPRTTVQPEEIDQFSRHAADWWNPYGSFKPLHRLNPVRVQYVRDQICALRGFKATGKREVLRGISLLDVGCGGGLLAEPLALLGARVTAIDASAATIDVASQHAAEQGLEIDYRVSSVEDLAQKPQRFDVITALEIVEHVADIELFLTALTSLLRPGGVLILSTLNQTSKSYLLGIVAAEYILRWVPRGTHQWKKFIRPSQLVDRVAELGLTPCDLSGLVFNPLRQEFHLSQTDLDVNYFLTAIKAA